MEQGYVGAEKKATGIDKEPGEGIAGASESRPKEPGRENTAPATSTRPQKELGGGPVEKELGEETIKGQTGDAKAGEEQGAEKEEATSGASEESGETQAEGKTNEHTLRRSK